MEFLQENWLLLLPLLVIQVGLLIASLIHVFRHDTYKIGNRAVWVIVCLVVSIIGPVLYFVIGRGEE
jgi:uncharacterized membrane protein YsdA (DUF1294 family)